MLFFFYVCLYVRAGTRHGVPEIGEQASEVILLLHCGSRAPAQGFRPVHKLLYLIAILLIPSYNLVLSSFLSLYRSFDSSSIF